MISLELSIAAALLGGYALLMLLLLCGALVRGALWRKRAGASAARLPEIRDALIDYLAGSNDRTRLQFFARASRRDLAGVLVGFRGTVSGSALDRLCDLALELALVHDWIRDTHSRDPLKRRSAFAHLAFVSAYEPCRRVTGDIQLRALADADPDVRLEAARGVTQSDIPEEIEAVFEGALSESLMYRIPMTEDLRPHAIELCERAIPRALRSQDPRRLEAALEMLVAWGRALPFDGLQGLLEHREKGIRIQALRLAPLVPQGSGTRAAVVRQLASDDPEVSTAAALSAGRMNIAEALPALSRLLRTAPAEVARGAAAALAEMPGRGWDTLEELSASQNPATAAAAREALMRARRKGDA